MFAPCPAPFLLSVKLHISLSSNVFIFEKSVTIAKDRTETIKNLRLCTGETLAQSNAGVKSYRHTLL